VLQFRDAKEEAAQRYEEYRKKRPLSTYSLIRDQKSQEALPLEPFAMQLFFNLT
jgi:RNase adaptor protein for sRNA GlmZ degradation